MSSNCKGRLDGGAYLSRVDELALPGCCPQLPIVSTKAAEASKLGEARADVKRLWAESERGAGTIVGGGRSNGGLWFVRRGEVNNCYLESEFRSDSQP